MIARSVWIEMWRGQRLEPGSAFRIVGALDEYEIKVTEKNVSNWKTRGGYAEWCQVEDRALELCLKQDNLVAALRRNGATEVPEVGLQVAATRMAEFFLTPEAAQLLHSNPEEYHRMAMQLSKLTAEIHKLQKYRDDNIKELGHAQHSRTRAPSRRRGRRTYQEDLERQPRWGRPSSQLYPYSRLQHQPRLALHIYIPYIL